ncbi:MAG: NAD-dependent DNA ligase LigA [Endomicrobium sp.]|jgi:DNA ligase (NAD+)|uniref:NAD-dependent DNA ligase LigA n=1 Tax=Candidatus Endomicrobiellum cubanum TaxID=3242325 RepID=UPI00281E20E5|nr:NAD-dependent DNA ligase LigA [Endomicrobium sp.]
MEDILRRITYLRKEIERHNALYYNENNPEISDSEYDSLVKELKHLEDESPIFVLQNSPTKKVSGFASSTFSQVEHQVPMLSLDNTYSKEEISKWYDRIVKKLPNEKIEFVIEPKIDGLSASLIYVDGLLRIGATRGDGQIGEDITENIKTIKDIPIRLGIEAPPTLFEVRGEVYINKTDFENLNKLMLENGEQKFANPRNAASGSLRQKNPYITSLRNLRFFAHSFGKIEGKSFDNQTEFLKFCKKCGFYLQDDLKRTNSLDEIFQFTDFILNKRELLNYEIDGLVIKVDDFLSQKKLGYTNRSPRWAIAFKFPAKQATTKLDKVRVQVGRTGIITPSAILEPVGLAGVIISHATLHNFEEIERLNVNEGDTVLVERAGDVIPKIVKVVRKNSEGFFKAPKKCPSCDSDIVKENEEEVAYRCINPDCPAQFRRHLIHFVSRDAMDIEGFGTSLIDQLLNNGKIHAISDIYHLTYDDFIGLSLFKEKKANNIVKSIMLSKSRPLSKLIFALGIRHVGQKTSEIIAEKFNTIDSIFKASLEDFKTIPEIGEVLAVSLTDFFKNPSVCRVINALKVVGVNMLEPAREKAGSIFYNKTFVLTGELTNYTRDEASKIIKSLGGKISSSVSKKTDFIFAGENAGSKILKAKELNIKIIKEAEFEKMLV